MHEAPPMVRNYPTKDWAEFDAKAAETATTWAAEWNLPATWGVPVRCTFLGPGTERPTPADRPNDGVPRVISSREQVWFSWQISLPDAPADFSSEEVVKVRADNALERGIPVPPQWDTVLPVRTRLQGALEAAAARSPGHECTLLGLCRKPAALLGQQVQPGPRVGSPWAFRAPSGAPVAVWVAGKGTADEWWCVKALSRIALPRLRTLWPRHGRRAARQRD